MIAALHECAGPRGDCGASVLSHDGNYRYAGLLANICLPDGLAAQGSFFGQNQFFQPQLLAVIESHHVEEVSHVLPTV